jgi:hypothetical protein
MASMGTAVVVVGIAGLLFRGFFPANERHADIPEEISSADSAHGSVQPGPDNIRPLIERLAANPLESEMRLLANDTQSALNYLAATFVPSEGDDASRL